LRPIDRASPYLRAYLSTFLPEDGASNQFPKLYFK
jgi:hypothetical protein